MVDESIDESYRAYVGPHGVTTDEGDTTWAQQAISGATMVGSQTSDADVFFGVPGANVHGAQFAGQALDRGCGAIITDEAGHRLIADAQLHPDRTVLIIVVPNVRKIIGTVTAWIYDDPSSSMDVIGVTGTNGKTTTTMFLRSALEHLNRHCGLVGTVHTVAGGHTEASSRTTLEAPDMQHLLRYGAKHGDSACAVEVSSQGIAAGRVDGLHFAAMGFLNLQRDHLDFHKTMEAYFQAKAQVFDKRYATSAVICVNDAWGRRLAKQCDLPTLTYSVEGRCDATEPPAVDCHISDITTQAGTLHQRMTVTFADGQSFEATCPMPAAHNIDNMVMAALLLVSIGVPRREAFDACAVDPHVPGRLQRVRIDNARTPLPHVFVDYAHSPDAIEATLSALAQITAGRLIGVVGATGNRDTGKRHLMGQVCATHCDSVYIVDDIPYNEDPYLVRQAVVQGITEAQQGQATGPTFHYQVDTTREEGIAKAIMEAGPNDIVVLLGRGHEVSMPMFGYTHYVDDLALATTLLNWLNEGRTITMNDVLYAAVRDDDPRRGDQHLTLTIDDAASATGASVHWLDATGADVTPPHLPPTYAMIFGAYTDSRQVTRSGMYVARVGETADGHSFITAALNQGAASLMVTDLDQTRRQVAQATTTQQFIPVLVVDDATEGFGRIAQAHIANVRRERADAGLPFDCCAVTGSAGKTTTKDLLVHILSQRGPTVGPEKSFNNEVGVPTTMMRAGVDTRYLVLEMGASEPGNIAYLTQFVDIDVAVELIVGTAHLGGYDSMEQLCDTKAALVDAVDSNGYAVLNADDRRVAAMADRCAGHVIMYSPTGDNPADVYADHISVNDHGHPVFTLHNGDATAAITSPLVGLHHNTNLVAAISAALALGVDLDDCVAAVNSFDVASPHRMDVRDYDGVTVIDDSFNANPDSVRAALDASRRLARGRSGHLVCVLGEMLELGESSAQLHRQVAREAVAAGCQLIIGVGQQAHYFADEVSDECEVLLPKTLAQARSLMEDRVSTGDTVLMKGSHGSGVWELAEQISSTWAPKE